MFKTLKGVIAALALVLVAAPVLSLSTVQAAGVRLETPASHSAPLDVLGTLAGLGVVGMAIKVKDATTVARKWAQRASAASVDYKDGVAASAGEWEQNALAGKDNYAAGVQQAIGDGRYERGIRESGGAKFASRASTIGATRFAPGVAASEGEMAKGVAPVLQVIAGLTLPPRRPKGDPGNMERANAVAVALRRMKVGR